MSRATRSMPLYAFTGGKKEDRGKVQRALKLWDYIERLGEAGVDIRHDGRAWFIGEHEISFYSMDRAIRRSGTVGPTLADVVDHLPGPDKGDMSGW